MVELVKLCNMQNKKLYKDKTYEVVITVENYFKTHGLYACLHVTTI